MLTPVPLTHGEMRLWITPLEEVEGHVLVTSSHSSHWAVVQLGDRPWEDMAQFRQTVECAASELVKLEPVRRIAEVQPAIPFPLISSLSLHITEECNLRCKHCFYLGDEKTASRRLSIDQIEKMLDQALTRGLKSVALAGGEPLLHPEFDGILELVQRRGLEVTVLTNGTTLDEARCRSLANAGCRVLVSLHGPNGKIHDRLTGAKTFSKALNAIKTLLRHSASERVMINCTLSDWNVDQLEQMVGLAEKIGVGHIRFMPLHRARIQGDDRPGFDYRSEKLARWAQVSAENLVSRRWKVGVSVGFTGLPGGTCEEPETVSLLPCGIGQKLVVAADGGVYPCTLLMSREFLIGNAEEGLDNLVSSPAFRELVTTLQNRHKTIARCKGCSLSGICRGGCPALAWQTSGSFHQPDPLCGANLAYSLCYFSLVAKQKMKFIRRIIKRTGRRK